MRKDSILKVIDVHCQNHTLADLKQGAGGISVYEIADQLHLLRNNVNVDVNKLFDEGKVIKISGDKKHQFYSQEHFTRLTHQALPIQTTCACIKDLLEDLHELQIDEDPFQALIGYNGSLKNAILSAKASILYPGEKLHSLLLGESGVGKSLFAEKIFDFGKQEGIFSNDAQFVVFNCADYANNAELLLAQLFGSIKGAYTGAETTREGLLKRANGGVLFLDEIHRLPPEGQEMLFYFIDKKKYRMLGEANSEHTAKVTLVMATTEDPGNHLLTTFLRRIPMVIKIPNLQEKSLSERKQLILHLFVQEATTIRASITIEKDAMTALLLYNPKGNIGQLKNDIKLAIARSYLDMRVQQETNLRIHSYALSFEANDSVSNLDIGQRREIEKVLLQDSYLVEPYQKVLEEDESTMLFTPPLLDTTKSDIQTTFEDYVEKLATSLEHNQLPSFIIDTEIREIMTFIHEWVLHNMKVLIDRSQSAALAFYLKNIRDNHADAFLYEEDLKDYDVDTLESARSLIRAVEQHFHIRIPNQEVHTLACILKTFTTNTLAKTTISMFVVAHGTALATNIAEVVNELLSIHYVIPIDMPLTKNVNQIIDELIHKIQAEPSTNEILLFVDMGSLTSLEETLKQRTKNHVVVIPTVHTLLVLDAARKAVFLQYSLSNILHDVMRMNQKLDSTLEHHIRVHIEQSSEKIIYTICYSGDGTAHYLEKYLKDILEDAGIFNIDILALSNDSLVKIRSMIEETSKNREVLCMIGNVDPGIHEYPFISIEDILMSDGIQRLFDSIGDMDILRNEDVLKSFERDVYVDVAFESIDKYLMYLNSKKLYPLIMNFLQGVEQDLHRTLSNQTLTRLIVHLSCMIERLLFDEYKLEQDVQTLENLKPYKTLYAVLQHNLETITTSCNITINQEECFYLIQIIESDDTGAPTAIGMATQSV